MKSFKIASILFSAIIALGLTSCKGCSSKKQADTHVHEDGTTHGNHADESKTPASQESFKAEADSTQNQTPATETRNDHGHDHSDESGHKH